MDSITLIGTIGGAIILFAFFMNQTNRWKNSDVRYDSVNALGSVLLVIYALLISSWPFLVLNIVWAAVSIKDVWTRK